MFGSRLSASGLRSLARPLCRTALASRGHVLQTLRPFSLTHKLAVDWTVGDDLTFQKCDPCEQGGKPLPREEAERLQQQTPEWKISEDCKSISRKWECKDFKTAFEFVERVAVLAENEGHHPDLHVTNYRNVDIVLWTHSLRGLSYNDFLLAMKIDFLRQPELFQRASRKRPQS